MDKGFGTERRGEKSVVLVTYDEDTFNANDRGEKV